MTRKPFGVFAFLLAFLLISTYAPLVARAGDPLPSWQDGAARQAIIGFVGKVTKKGGPDYVPPAKRIAVFDNDGTLWAEKPIYFQMVYALDRVKQMAPKHPEWKTKEPFASVLSGDPKRLAKLGHKEIFQLIAATHAGMTTEQFAAQVGAWLKTARHPQKKRPYTSMVYQPMLELLSYLRSQGFKNFIVSGGGVEFMRVFAEKVYGIPPEQVIGSSLKSKWEIKSGKPVIVKLPQINSLDDKEVKPLNINLHIGRHPILAAGNSDGDLAMLEWTDAGPGPKLMLLVHHDDAKREWAYDRKSSVGRLDKALDMAQKRGWTVISMRADFGRVFPAEK